MKFQRYLIASLLLAGSSSAMAATTDTVSLQGTVASTLSISCADTADTKALVLDGVAGEQIVKVSDCAATTNSDSGLTVTFTPTAYNLTGDAADVFVFAVKALVDGAAAPVTGDFTASAPTSYISDGTSGSKPSDLWIRFTQDAASDPGTYTGSVGVVVADTI